MVALAMQNHKNAGMTLPDGLQLINYVYFFVYFFLYLWHLWRCGKYAGLQSGRSGV